MPDYQKGKIYKILNTIDDEIYVGSTCETLSQRMARHRATCKRNNSSLIYKHMNQLGVEHFYIELIEDWPCDRIDELLKREGEIIRSIGTLNKSGKINVKENMNEYHKQYHHDNLEKRREQKKQWYENNKDNIKEHNENNKDKIKEYYENNKDKIKEYYENNKDKIKEYYENNKDKIKDKSKEYYENNKDKIKGYYEQNKEQIKQQLVECECGCVMNVRSLAKHKQSKKHKQLLAK
jgi:molecular chaperone DnaK (HSP70)